MSSASDAKALLGVAEYAARIAGDHAFKNQHRRNEIAEKTDHDVKLQLDLECQALAEEVVRSSYPDHAILGEEGGAFPEGNETLWIIDPLDGTVNFSHGMPLWCSSIAVRVGQEDVAGCVYAPAMNECYLASKDAPATCNGERIHPSTVETLADAMVLTGLSKSSEVYGDTLGLVNELAFKAQKVRMMGAAALDLCHVACGRAEASVELTIYLWDIAAAGLIARQAGARTEVLEPLSDLQLRYLCTNGKVHEELKEIALETLKR